MNETGLRFFDTHFHTANLLGRSPNLVNDLGNAIQNGSLTQGIDIGINPQDQIERLPLIQKLGIAWYSVGIYPSHAADLDLSASIKALADFIQSALNPQPQVYLQAPRLVAIGEIGIDLFHDYAALGLQQDLLRAQISLANQFGLPVIIHNRNADQALLESIMACPPQAGGILHCFSSTWELAVKLIDYGFKVSFAGNLTYRANGNLRDVASRLDSKALLCETDSPYLSPEPFRAKVNWPGQVRLVYDCLAQIRKVPIQELCQQIETNLDTLVHFTSYQAAKGLSW